MGEIAFSPSLAREAAMRCAVAYTDPNHTAGNGQFRSTVLDDGLHIDIAGTNSLKDGFQDLNARFIHTDYGLVHKGFWEHFQTLLPGMEAKASKGVRVTFSGHSLGAAVAVLASVHFKALGYEVGECFAFGCPRVGGKDWLGEFLATGVTAWRVIYGRDAVTMNPPGEDWFHVPQSVYLDLNGNIVGNRISAWSWNPWRLLTGWLADHASLDSYLLALARLEARGG